MFSYYDNILGFLLDKINNEVAEFDCITGEGLDTADYSIPFFIFAGVNALLILILIFLNIDAKKENDENREEGKDKQRKSWKEEWAWLVITIIRLYTASFIKPYRNPVCKCNGSR